MKSIKMALLGGAALAVTAAGAQADDLDALKAQIETLSARVAAMETAPAVPAGYQLLTVSEGKMPSVPGMEIAAKDKWMYSDTATVISVLPTADAPAGASIAWSGFVRSVFAYSDTAGSEDDDDNDPNYDINVRGQLNVVATTDTAVGEIGVKVSLRGDFKGIGAEFEGTESADFEQSSDVNSVSTGVTMPEAWGWWAVTPEITLAGGYSGTLGNIGYGYNSVGVICCSSTGAMNPGDTHQMRLTYASGPISFAVAVEDSDKHVAGVDDDTDNDGQGVGFAGQVSYSGDTFSAEISGYSRNINEDHDDDSWGIGGGVAATMDMFTISLAAQTGERGEGDDEGFLVYSAAVTASLTDEFSVMATVQREDLENDDLTTSWGAGAYWNPVDQLTIGLEVEYVDSDNDGDDVSETTLVHMPVVWRF